MSDERVVVVPDDPEWPRLFDVERVLLERVLAPWFEGGIHHVGSTSIPGIAAKPLIDMIAGVRISRKRAARSSQWAVISEEAIAIAERNLFRAATSTPRREHE